MGRANQEKIGGGSLVSLYLYQVWYIALCWGATSDLGRNTGLDSNSSISTNSGIGFGSNSSTSTGPGSNSITSIHSGTGTGTGTGPGYNSTTLGSNFGTSTNSDANDDLNLPIAIRKGVRSCTHHPISQIVSFQQFSPQFQAFLTQIAFHEVSSTV